MTNTYGTNSPNNIGSQQTNPGQMVVVQTPNGPRTGVAGSNGTVHMNGGGAITKSS